MKGKYEVTLHENCYVESTVIIDVDFRNEDEDDFESLLISAAHEAVRKGEGTESRSWGDIADSEWKEIVSNTADSIFGR